MGSGGNPTRMMVVYRAAQEEGCWAGGFAREQMKGSLTEDHGEVAL